MGLSVVSGVVSTLVDIGQDEAWLRDWLRERPARLGLGELHVIEDAAVEDGATAFLADDEARVFSVGVRLGELEAADAFDVLQGWAGSRAHAPEKDHVAVLVTERLPERYRATLEALAERLPLVVVGLSVWRGESEAIVVPHVTLASDALDLSSAPATAAASVMATAQAESSGVATTTEAADAGTESVAASTTGEDAPGEGSEIGEPTSVEATTEAEASDEAEASTDAGAAADEGGTASPDTADQESGEDDDPLARLGGRDDTGISDPWRLARSDGENGLLKGSYTAVGSR
jgi:hypothetical protein